MRNTADRRVLGPAQDKPIQMAAPFVWFGGKGQMQRKIISLLPHHLEYIEPFFGAGSVFFAKQPAQVETINDLNSSVMDFFRVLRDRPQEFLELANLTLWSRELFEECRAHWWEETEEVRRAWRWWVVARMSFSGCFGGSFSTSITTSSRGIASTCSKMLRTLEYLPQMVDRLQRTQIENTDALKVLERYCTPQSLCYLDPPYVMSTRESWTYDKEMTSAEHRRLVKALLSELPGRFLLSGYRHPIYVPLEDSGWKRIDFKTACHAAGNTRDTGIQGKGSALRHAPRIESVWLDPQTAREVLR